MYVIGFIKVVIFCMYVCMYVCMFRSEESKQAMITLQLNEMSDSLPPLSK